MTRLIVCFAAILFSALAAHGAEKADVAKIASLVTPGYRLQREEIRILSYESVSDSTTRTYSDAIVLFHKGKNYRIELHAYVFSKERDRRVRRVPLPIDKQQLFITVWPGPRPVYPSVPIPDAGALLFFDRGLDGKLDSLLKIDKIRNTEAVFPLQTGMTPDEEQAFYDLIVLELVAIVDGK